eukprot:Pgem_evm1s1088
MVKIQAFGRMVLQRNMYLAIYNATVMIQCVARTIIASRVVEELRQEKAAILLQKHIRGYLAYTNFTNF